MFTLVLVLLVFGSFSSCFSSLLKDELLRYLADSGNPSDLFYDGLNFTFGNSYRVGYSEIKYNPACISVHRTNSLLYVGCQLPRRCGTPIAHIFDKNLFGQETVLCYSFHDKFESNLRYAEFDISHFDIDLTYPYSRSDLRYLKAVRPVTLNMNFYLLFNSSRVALLPRICTMFYPSNVDTITSYLTIEGNSDEVCVEIPSATHMSCKPLWFTSLDSLMKYYVYPVSYAGAPHDEDETLGTNLKGASLLYKALKPEDNYTLVSHREGKYFASYYRLDDAITVIPLRFPPLYEEKICMRVQSAYLNPVSSVFHYLISQLDYVFSEILDVLSGLIEDLLKFLIDAVIKIVDVVLNMVPYPSLFITSFVIFLFIYFMLSNFYQSLVISVVSYFFQIYINDSIKNI
nr:MAG: hypothetical protein 2 [Virgaviridae sp.]